MNKQEQTGDDMKIKISEKLKTLPMIDYRILKPLQGKLKDLHDKEYKRLLNIFMTKSQMT